MKSSFNFSHMIVTFTDLMIKLLNIFFNIQYFTLFCMIAAIHWSVQWSHLRPTLQQTFHLSGSFYLWQWKLNWQITWFLQSYCPCFSGRKWQWTGDNRWLDWIHTWAVTCFRCSRAGANRVRVNSHRVSVNVCISDCNVANIWLPLISMALFMLIDTRHQRKKSQMQTQSLTANRH